MGAPGLTSPIRMDAFKNLQLNAGIFLINFDYSTIATAAALKTAVTAAYTTGTLGVNHLGITRGGGTFTITREVRTPEVDGRRYAFVGDKFVDSMDGYLSTTLLEATPEVVSVIMSTSDVATNGGKTTISFHTAIDAEHDYLEHLCWVGDLADGGYILIELDNAFNTADLSFTFADKNEMTMPVEFHAHQGEVLDYDTAPCRIVYFKDSTSNGNT